MKILSKYEFYCISSLVFFMTLPSPTRGSSCSAREKCVMSLEIAGDIVSNLLPNCLKVAGNTSECGLKEKVSSFLDMTNNLISDVKENYPTCVERKARDPVRKPQAEQYPKSRDCSEVLQKGQKESGVYTIWPNNPHFPNKSIDVYCDMDNQGGGWTVMQRRGNFTPQEDFYRGWSDYKNGFGNLTRDFWLGNDNLYILSNQGNYTIRIDLTTEEGNKEYDFYKTFRVEDEKAKYKLHIDGNSGDAGNILGFHDGMQFSTKDRRNHAGGNISCAEKEKGGWWYLVIMTADDPCSQANLNGEYNYSSGDRDKTVHLYEYEVYKKLAYTEMKLKLL